MAKSGGLNYGVPKKQQDEIVVKNTSVIESFIKDTDAIDLSNRNIGGFYNQLQESINKKTPMFLWSKERQNNKVRLDNEYQILILEKIINLRAISEEYNRLQADEIFSGEFIRNLVANKRMEAEHYFEKAVAAHRVELTKMKVDMDLTNSLIDHDQIEKDRKIAENEKLRAEAEAIRADNLIKYAQADRIKAESDGIRRKNDLFTMVISKINFDNFPPVHLTYLLSVLAGFNVDVFNDLDIKEKMKSVWVDMEDTKRKKAEAELDDFINSAEFRKWKNDQAKKDAGL